MCVLSPLLVTLHPQHRDPTNLWGVPGDPLLPAEHLPFHVGQKGGQGGRTQGAEGLSVGLGRRASLLSFPALFLPGIGAVSVQSRAQA